MKFIRGLAVLAAAVAWSSVALAQKDTLTLGMSVGADHARPHGRGGGLDPRSDLRQHL